MRLSNIAAVPGHNRQILSMKDLMFPRLGARNVAVPMVLPGNYSQIDLHEEEKLLQR